jgi:hypothetical protein
MDALAACSTLRVDQAAIIVLLRRRYVIAPMPMKPRITMAHVDGCNADVVQPIYLELTLAESPRNSIVVDGRFQDSQ